MLDNNTDDEELRRFAEQGGQGLWYLCPQCLSKDVWRISFEFKKGSGEKWGFKSSTIGSMCEKCKFLELAPDMDRLGMGRIDWNLVAREKKVI